jgi:Tol biopolymer transport system component/C-terminal processing protease CtpA/Prc
MTKTLFIVGAFITAIAVAPVPSGVEGQPRSATVTPLPSFAEPGISADGSTIAFVSGGDIWEVPSRGGDARLLVSHPATESRPLFSPDGRRLAFTSTRTGGGDVYVLTLATGELTRLTFDDANELVSGWSPDSKAIYFQSTSHEISGLLDVYRVGAEGGTPMQVAGDRYTTEYFAAPSSSGAMAITARANAASQWWRKGHSHLDESEIWIVRNTAYQAVTNGGAKDAWPMWDGDGKALYFMSDRSGAQNIWAVPAAAQGFGAARAITNFKDGRVLWPTISKDGKTIAFERDFGIWTVDTAGGQPREVAITLRGAPAAAAVEHRTFSDQIQELALSPDGKKIAFTVHGEVFSASAKDGGDAVRVTNTAGDDAEIVWAPDSRRLAYMSDRDGTNHLFLYDFATGGETQLTSGRGRDDMPRFSPDGKWLAFERDSRELRVIDLGAPAAPPGDKAERLVATGVFDTPPFFDARDIAWSPDSRFIAYVSAGAKTFANVHVAAVTPGASPALKAGEGRAISFLANTNAGSLSWSPDGTYLTLATAQRTEPGDVIRIDLLPRTPKFREDQFRDLFKEDQPKTTPEPPRPTTPEPAAPPAAAPAAAATTQGRAKPVDIVFDDIRRRASSLPTGVDVTRQEISPDGKWLLLTASAAGQQNLYVFSIDELSREPAVARQLTSTPGQKRSAHFTADSKEVYYLDRGRVFNVTLERREPKAIAVSAELDVDFSREKVEAFHQAWTYLRDQFFDEKMNGVDWNAVRATYEPRVAGSRTPDEMRRIISMMLGELNASHMGVSAPPQGAQTTLGRLAIDFDRGEYDASGRLKIASVVALGPAAIAGIKAGDLIQSVDGKPIAPRQNVDELLDHTIGKRIALGISSSATGTPAGRGAGAPAVENVVVVKPVDQQTEKGLRYREWVEQKRAYVAKASGGRLGYVHMFDMSANSLSQLHVDLDAENHSRDGVVVDVRTNNGGFVNVYAIDVFARRGYFNMLSRGYPSVSSRTALGQRALELPTILVTNQHSLSDAEDFTEGYRTLKLGKVVGEPTAGWIIYTGGVTLVDGSVLRMPGTKIFASDGTPMEMHPRPVDIPVKRPVGESYSGKDSQLDAAVAELLKQIGSRTKTTAQ